MTNSLPLQGVIAVDLADEPLAMAGRLLADLGARVIRVESKEGDWLRRKGPFVGGIPGTERSLAHILNNAAKESLALDLEREAAWEIVERVLDRANILISPMEPGPLAREHLRVSKLTGRAPSLGIVDAVFRRDAEETAVSDLAGTAAGGLLRLNGDPEDPPNHPAGQLAYKQTSLAAAWAAMSLILQQASTGRGGHITVSMQEAVMWTTIQTANENYWYWHEMRPNRTGIAGLGGRSIYQAGDGGWVSFSQHPPAWPAYADWIATALGDATFTGPEWSDGLYRLENSKVIAEATIRLCASMDRASLVKEAQRRNILVVPVQDAGDISRDPHLRERDFFQTVRYDQLGQDLEVLRPPFRSTAFDLHARPAPALGQHSVAVLRDLGGYTTDEVDRLIEAGIVLAPQEVSS